MLENVTFQNHSSIDDLRDSFKKYYFFIWLLRFLVTPREHLDAACRIYFPDQGWNLGPLHWECRILAA